MTMTEAMWLRGQAAQRDVLHLVSYGTAFAGTAAVQGMALGLSAPRTYWSALGRAAVGRTPAPVRAPGPSVAEVVTLTPQPPAVGAEPEITPSAPSPSAVPSPHLLDAPRGGVADDLSTLKGVGPKLAQTLNRFGIYHFDQIAGLDEDGIAWLDARQKGFRMICARHDIVTQARTRA